MIDKGGTNRRGSLEARQLFETARDLFLEGRHRESIEVYTRFMAMIGEKTIALLSRGVAYLKSGQSDRAIEDFSKVIDSDSLNFRAFFYRGIAHMTNKAFNSAVEDFSTTIELKPDYGAAFFARGSAHAQSGNQYEAARNIKTAIMLSERNRDEFNDSLGLFRTQFDKAMTVMSERQSMSSMTLTPDEIRKVKQWLDEKNH